MPQRLCLICGSHKDEVEKMHRFPRNPEKCKIWQEKMHIKCMPGISLQNFLICSRHFEVDCYKNYSTRELSKDAVPSLFPCSHQSHSSTVEVEQQHIVKSVTPEPIASGSGIETSVSRGIEVKPVTPEPTPTSSGIKTPMFRGIEGVSRIDATPRKQKLMIAVENKESHIRKLKKMCMKRANNIRVLSNLSNSSVVRNIFKGMSASTSDFLISQLRCAKRDPKGRRWTIQEKVIALALLKRSPRCYNLLKKIVAMPSKRTLLRLLERVPFQSGINEHLFKHISQCLKAEQEKFCVLLFDEMDIKEHLQYDAHLDRILGFEQLDVNSTSKKWANRALVFMLQGLAKNWKQPVAYYFSNNGCPSNILKKCIEEVINAAFTIGGVHVVATICDMGSTNVKTLKEMGSSLEHPFILCNGKKIHTIYDPPHLLKCTASLFRKHNLCLPVSIANKEVTMEARFSDIVRAHDIDKNSPLIFRAMHKIKDQHLQPVMQYAMKVNIAAQVLSRTVAAFLYTLLSRGELDQRSLATATFVSQMDELFDSFNGSRMVAPEGKELKCCVSESSPHMDYWLQAFKMVKSWHFERKMRTNTKPPSQVGWLTSLRAVREIWIDLNNNRNFNLLRTRSLNQDALENLFGVVRSGCGTNDNPTTIQFAGSLKTQILNGLTKQTFSGGNCEEDDHELLTNLMDFIGVDAENEQLPTSKGVLEGTHVDGIAAEVTKDMINMVGSLSVAYVSGFIAKRILAKINCQICKDTLLSTSDKPHNLFIMYKEWSEKEHLQYPSEELTVTVGHCITSLEFFLTLYCDRPDISKLFCDYIKKNVDFSFLNCNVHHEIILNSCISSVCKIGIPWWCTRSNRERKQIRKNSRASKKKLKKMSHK